MSGLGLWGIRSTLCDRRDYSDPELSDINTRIFHEHKRVGFFLFFILTHLFRFGNHAEFTQWMGIYKSLMDFPVQKTKTFLQSRV